MTNVEDLSYDEWDGLLITEWFEADPGAPVPASSREDQYDFCFENPAAWDFVDYERIGMQKNAAFQIIENEARFLEILKEPRINVHHDKLGKFAKASGVAVIDRPGTLSNRKADDLASRVQKPDGGFTVDPRTGKDVKTGYAVAIYPDRSSEIPHKAVGRETIQKYAEDNKDLLVQDGNMMGGWHDPDTGNVWLDVSRVTSDKREAIDLAKQHNQIAIFDLGTGNSINTGGTGRSSYPFVFTRADKLASRASQLSTVERRIIKSNNICERCRLNNDPNNVPVHPNCDCNVVTDSITTGVADSKSRFLETLTNNSIDIEVVNGELESAGIQLEPGSVAIMDVENVRFGDLARWLESVQPYLDAGANYVSIVVDDDTEEAIAQVQEAVEAIAEDSEQIIEAIQNRKLWFAIAKAVAV